MLISKFLPRFSCMTYRTWVLSHNTATKEYGRFIVRKPVLGPIYPITVLTHRSFGYFNSKQNLKKRDRIPDNFIIIYRAPMYNYVLAAHSVIVLSGIAILFTLSGNIINLGLPSLLDFEFICSLGALLLLNIAMYRVLITYVLRIYYNEKDGSYIAVKSGLLPLLGSKSVFSKGEVKKCNSGILPWRENMYNIDGKESIIFEYSFRKISDFNQMLSTEK